MTQVGEAAALQPVLQDLQQGLKNLQQGQQDLRKDNKDLQQGQQDLQQGQQDLRNQVLELRPNTDLTATPATRADRRRQTARVLRLDEGDETVLPSTVLKALAKAKSEAEANAAMEAFLQTLKPEHFLVNCEHFDWAANVGTCDFFASRCYVERQLKDQKKQRKGTLYGIPALLDSVSAVYEGKLNLMPRDEDQIFKQLNATTATHGLLYDKNGFTLLQVAGQQGQEKALQKIWYGRWNSKGVKQLFQDQFRDEPFEEELLGKCLASSKTHMLGFLGKGGNGMFFAVKRGVQKMALKILKSKSDAELEVGALQKAYEAKLPVVQPVGAAVQVVENGSYFLMKPAGQQVTKEFARQNVPRILNTLHKLHEAGHVHGDARVQNMIIGPRNQLLWVDFLQTRGSYDESKIQDIKMLCRSLGVPANTLDECTDFSLTNKDFQRWVQEHLQREQ